MAKDDVSDEEIKELLEYLDEENASIRVPPEGKLCENCRYPLYGDGCRAYWLDNINICWEPEETEQPE